MHTQPAWWSRSLVRWLVTAICSLAGVAPAVADQFYYTRSRGNADGATGLFLWNDVTGAVAQVGGDGAVYLREPTDGNLLVLGLAANSSGTLYGFALDNTATPGFLPFTAPSCSASTNRSRLVTIDTTTAIVTYVGPWITGKLFVGAGFDGQGRLWAIDCRASQTWQINLATGDLISPAKISLPTSPMVVSSDIDFAANGLAIIKIGGNEFLSLNPDANKLGRFAVDTLNQGFDSFGLAGFAFTTHLDPRSGDTAASECRMNVLDETGNDELGHINDPFVVTPQQAVRDALQYNPGGVVFDAGVGSLTRANGPALPDCFYDWGDAPDSYHTSLATDGPRHHIVTGGPFVGAGLPNFEAQSAIANSELDKDAFQNLRPVRGMSRQFQITAGNVGPNTRVQLWIDWDADGSFDQPGNRILTDAIVANGVNTFTVTQPLSSPIGQTWARVRIANQSGLGATGPAADGEVEDLQVPLTLPVDIGVSVTDNREVYQPGTNVVYTITYTNFGPYDATGSNLLARDVPAAGTTGAGWSCVSANGGTCNPATGGNGPLGTFPGTIARFVLPVGGSVTYTFTTSVSANFTGNLVNTPTWVNSASFVTDINPSNDTATDTDVPDAADVAIVQSGPVKATPGAYVVYTSTITNNGPATATAVSVSDTPPAGLTFVANAGDCTTAFPCALGDLAVGAARTITTTYRVPTSYTSPDPIIYTATITTTRTDPSAANNSASSSTPLGPAQSDLQIVKSVSAAAVAPGENYTYTLQARNNGPSDAANVRVTDTLPPQATFVSSAAGCTAVGQMVSCPTVPVMAAGATATFDLMVRLDPTYVGDGANVVNSGTVTADTGDPAPQNNTNPAGAPPVGPAGADVTIVKTVSSDPVVPGQTFTYNLLVSNQGPSTATDVVVTDPLPSAMMFVSSPTGCTAIAQDVTCPTIAVLNPGASTTFMLVVQLDPNYTGDGSDLGNRATVHAATPDPVPGNDTTPPVSPPLAGASADLSATKVAIGNAIAPGTLFTYRITVSNAGPSTAANVVVTDTLPAPLTFISSPSGCSAIGQIVTCTRDGIRPDTTATFELLVQLSPSYAGDGSDLVNVATVTSSTSDPNPANDQPAPAPAPPIGVGEADVTITKTGPYGVAPAGGEIVYTIVVTNQGPNAATDVLVTDPTPAGLTFIATAGDCTTPFPCALATLLPGQVRTITARYAVAPSVTGVISNTATVMSTTPDPSPANNTATSQTPPPPITYYLAEGATGTFWDEDLVIANPNAAAAPVTLRFLKDDGSVVTQTLTVAAAARTTVRVDAIAGLEASTASAEIASEDGVPLAIERTMTWDAGAYGAHAATAVTQAATRWYFAEGAQGLLHTFVLLENPQAAPADVTVTFLRELDTPVVRTLTLAARSRTTLQTLDIPELQDRPFGIVVDATQPIVAERSMYLQTSPSLVWNGGHASAGVTEPAQRWFYAEGATGSFFDTFILLSNPQTIDARVTMEYILSDGTTISVPKIVPAQGRLTVNIDAEDDPRLHAAMVSTRIQSDVPIVTERSMYWNTKPDTFAWSEGHNTFGVDQTAARWAVADGRVGGPHQSHTYILLSNPWATAAEVQVTYLRENGATPVVTTYTVPPTTRYTIDVNEVVSELQDEGFGARIEVTNGLTIGVERSVYWDANGVFWSAGTNAAGTKLP